MPKKNALCTLCGARKNLNYANLCKRCNASPNAAKIKGRILGEKSVAQAMKKERLAEEAEAAAEEAPVKEANDDDSSKEEKGEESSAEEKKD